MQGGDAQTLPPYSFSHDNSSRFYLRCPLLRSGALALEVMLSHRTLFALLVLLALASRLHATNLTPTLSAQSTNSNSGQGTVSYAGHTITYSYNWVFTGFNSSNQAVFTTINQTAKDDLGYAGNISWGWTGTSSAGANAGSSVGLAVGTYYVTPKIFDSALGLSGSGGSYVPGTTQTVVITYEREVYYNLPDAVVPVYWVFTDANGNVIAHETQQPGPGYQKVVSMGNTSGSVTAQAVTVDPNNQSEVCVYAYSTDSQTWIPIDVGPINIDGSLPSGTGPSTGLVASQTSQVSNFGISSGATPAPSQAISPVVATQTVTDPNTGLTHTLNPPTVQTSAVGTATVPTTSGTALDTQTATNLSNNQVSAINSAASRVVSAIQAKSSGSSGSGSGTDNAGIESRLDTGNTNTAAIKADLDPLKAILAPTTPFSVSGASSAASAAGSGAATYGGVTPNSSSSERVTLGSSGPGVIGSAVSIGSSSVSLDMSTTYSGANGILLWGRALILWAAVAMVIRRASKTVTGYLVGLSSVNAQSSTSGSENLVPGVSQSKSIASAGLAVTVMMSGAAAVIGLANTYFASQGGSVSSLFGSVDLTGAGSGLVLLNRYIPIAGLITLGFMDALFPFAVAPIYLGTAAVLKFMSI